MESEYSDLIIRHIQGRLSKEEAECFYVWVSNTANKKLYFETKMVYDSCITVPTTYNLENSWKRLLQKREKCTVRPISFWQKAMPYAAVALIAFALSSMLFFFTNTDTEEISARYIGGDGLIADVVVLPDGTRVSLGSKTEFTYDKEYGKSKRIVYLKGEAFFDVAAQKDKPFIVKVKGQDIEALGTKFNVTGYVSDSLLTTTLVEGSVRLTTALQEKRVTLKPNQQLVYNKKSNNLAVTEVDVSRVTSWTTGYYYFQKQTLEAILDRMSHIYGVQIFVSSEKLNSKVFTGTFYRGQSIRDIMDIIKISIPIKYKMGDDNQVFVTE